MASGRDALDARMRLELDIEVRMHSLVLGALADSELDGVAVAGLLRLAYGAGYTDALSEPLRGQLCVEHGFRVPTPRRA